MKHLSAPNGKAATRCEDADGATGRQTDKRSYSDVLTHPSRTQPEPPKHRAAGRQQLGNAVAVPRHQKPSSARRQSATSRDASGERHHYPSGPRVPGRRPTNHFESIDRSASHRRAGARPSLPSRPPPKPPLPQISKVGFGASGTPVQRGASQGGTPSGSEKRDGGEPSKDVKGQGEDAGQPGASGGPLGGAGGGGRRPGDDERDDDKRKKGKGSSSGGGEKKKEEQEKKAKKERDQREEAKKESKPVDGREARGKEVKQGGGGLSSDSGKGSTGEEAGKKKAKKDRGRRAIEGTAGDVTDAGVTSEATGGVPKEAEPQKDGEDRGVHGGGRGGEGPGSAGATETGDALQHDSGGIGSGSEDRDKSRSETAAREKQVSKRQKSSGGRRKKKGASVAPQTGQTTTGEAPRSAVDSEGGRAGPLAASDKNKAGTDEGGRDAKGDEDGEAATAGPRAGAQHTGEHGGETEVVGETVKVAEADEEGSDAAAQREALRTGARPKTSSAAGRRKQKMKEQHAEQAESVSTRVSAAAEDQEVASRGRARHRTRAPDTRAGTGGSHKGVKASLGPSDGKGGQDGDVTVMSGKVTKNPVEKTSRPLSVGYDAMVASLQDKYLSIVAAYETRLRMFQAEPGVKCFMDLVDSPAFHDRLFSPVEFHLLTKLLLLNEEFVCQLDSLCAVARGLHMKALEQSRAERLHKFTVDAKAKRGATKTSPFSSILSMISARGRAAHDVSIRLLRAETTQRCKIISLLHMPPFREAVLPSFVKGEAYDPDSDEILYTSEGVTLRAADPLSGVELLRDQLQHWLPLVAPAVAAVETQWWIPPSDPDEAKRQHERTEAVFHAAALFVTSNAFKNAAEQWKTSSPEMTVSDPDLKAKVETAVLRLRSYSEEAVQQMGQQLKLYAQSFRQTARANLRNPQNRWDPLPDSSHAPDIRGATEYEARNAPGESAAAKEQATTVADVPKTQDDQGGDGPAS